MKTERRSVKKTLALTPLELRAVLWMAKRAQERGLAVLRFWSLTQCVEFYEQGQPRKPTK